VCVGARGLYKAKGRSLELDLTPWITQPTCLGGQADCKARGKESRGPAEAALIIYSAKGCFCVSYLKRILFFWGGFVWGFGGDGGFYIVDQPVQNLCSCSRFLGLPAMSSGT
jgi:hypothetical protein